MISTRTQQIFLFLLFFPQPVWANSQAVLSWAQHRCLSSDIILSHSCDGSQERSLSLPVSFYEEKTLSRVPSVELLLRLPSQGGVTCPYPKKIIESEHRSTVIDNDWLRFVNIHFQAPPRRRKVNTITKSGLFQQGRRRAVSPWHKLHLLNHNHHTLLSCLRCPTSALTIIHNY